jgi:hypothetical protein
LKLPELPPVAIGVQVPPPEVELLDEELELELLEEVLDEFELLLDELELEELLLDEELDELEDDELELLELMLSLLRPAYTQSTFICVLPLGPELPEEPSICRFRMIHIGLLTKFLARCWVIQMSSM